ncbi:MAG TPA: hypothetical protein VGE01_14420 [Fimbriimonas sp.]
MGVTIAASAPGRCGILGNPSDIYGGKVLSCSLPARAQCRLTLDVETSLPDDATLWEAATRRFPLDKVRVEWSSDVPRSSGLAGSTALLAATLACILKARGEEPDLATPEGLAAFSELVRDVERYDAGVVCGFQDAYMAVHGGLQSMSFDGKRPDRRGGPAARMEPLEAELPFLLVTTGVERLSGSVHGPMAERWLRGDREVRNTMERLPAMAEAGVQALLEGDDERLAALMTENQRMIAALGGSGEAIDRLIERCLKHGARAAKLAGAGMGGTVIALTRTPDELADRLRGDGYGRFMQPQIAPGVRFE